MNLKKLLLISLSLFLLSACKRSAISELAKRRTGVYVGEMRESHYSGGVLISESASPMTVVVLVEKDSIMFGEYKVKYAPDSNRFEIWGYTFYYEFKTGDSIESHRFDPWPKMDRYDRFDLYAKKQ